MKQGNALPSRAGTGLLRLLLAAAAAWTLAGCAAGVGAGTPGDGKTDVVTASDEPDARRRARIRLELAVSYFEEGKTTIALDELKQALVVDPSYAEAYNLRGLVYMRLNDLRLAEDSFRRAVALNPRDAGALQNVGWLLCQSGRYAEANEAFNQALVNPLYGDRAKTYLTMGLCQARAGRADEAEHSLTRSYELDAGNPITGFNLAGLLLKRGDLVRAQFYIRRLNNSELANAESLWLGIRVERRIDNPVAMQQLVDQMKKRFPQARELTLYERGAFDE
jgi:type IV pilus assembly protein PilF